MANTYATILIPSQSIKIDNRVTIKAPIAPVSANVVDGPTVHAISGVRVNEDIDF